MASVKSVTLFRAHKTNGRDENQYTVTLTDNGGNDYETVTMPRAQTGNVVSNRILTERREAERHEFKRKIRNDQLVDFRAGAWNTQAELFRSIGIDAFKAEKNDSLNVNFVQYFNALSDAQLKNIFGKGDQWLTAAKAKALQLENLRLARDAYTPEDLS